MKLKVHSLSFILVLVCVVGVFTLPAHAADVNDVYNLLQSTLNSSSYGQGSTFTKISNIYSVVNQYLPNLYTINSSLNSIESYTSSISSNVSSIKSSVSSVDSKLTTTNSHLSNISSYSSTSASNTTNILSGLSATLPDIKDSVVQLQEVLASDEDLAIRQDQQSRTEQISDDFLSSSGDASVSLGDLGSAKDSVGALKGALSGGASASSLWDIFDSSSSAWGWFSQATADDLDQSGLSLQGEVSYSYLNDYYNEVGLSLGGEYND